MAKFHIGYIGTRKDQFSEDNLPRNAYIETNDHGVKCVYMDLETIDELLGLFGVLAYHNIIIDPFYPEYGLYFDERCD